MDIENEPAQHYSDKTKSQLYQALKESETDLYIPQRLSTLRQIKNILEIKSPDAFAAQIEELQSNLTEKKPKLYNFKDVVFRMLVSNDLKSDLNSAVDYLYNTYGSGDKIIIEIHKKFFPSAAKYSDISNFFGWAHDMGDFLAANGSIAAKDWINGAAPPVDTKSNLTKAVQSTMIIKEIETDRGENGEKSLTELILEASRIPNVRDREAKIKEITQYYAKKKPEFQEKWENVPVQDDNNKMRTYIEVANMGPEIDKAFNTNLEKSGLPSDVKGQVLGQYVKSQPEERLMASYTCIPEGKKAEFEALIDSELAKGVDLSDFSKVVESVRGADTYNVGGFISSFGYSMAATKAMTIIANACFSIMKIIFSALIGIFGLGKRLYFFIDCITGKKLQQMTKEKFGNTWGWVARILGTALGVATFLFAGFLIAYYFIGPLLSALAGVFGGIIVILIKIGYNRSTNLEANS